MIVKGKRRKKTISLGIFYDSLLAKEGLAALLSKDPNLELCFAVNHPEGCLEQLGQGPTDLLLLLLKEPLVHGVNVTQVVGSLYPEVKVLVLSDSDEPASILALREAGARGYLLGDTDRKELMRAIGHVHLGRLHYQGSAARAVLKDKSRVPVNGRPISPLTSRELDVLRCIMQGMTTQNIARVLGISVHTVETHRKHLLLKTGTRNSVNLVRYAMEHQLAEGAPTRGVRG
jgi:DNA-binding NarL/FixJ family response regulator